MVMVLALGVCWPELDVVAEEGLVRVFRVFWVFEVVGFAEPVVTVEAPELPGFPVFPPPVPWVAVVAEGAGVEFAGEFEVEVEPPPPPPPPPRRSPTTLSTVSPTPPRVSPRNPRPLSCRTSRGTFALRAKSASTALKERNWIAAACARGREGVLT